jgi:chromosomal replication initiator protein
MNDQMQFPFGLFFHKQGELPPSETPLKAPSSGKKSKGKSVLPPEEIPKKETPVESADSQMLRMLEKEIIKALKENLPTDLFNLYFSHFSIKSIQNSTIILFAKTEFVKKVYEQHFQNILEQLFQTSTGIAYKVHFEIETVKENLVLKQQFSNIIDALNATTQDNQNNHSLEKVEKPKKIKGLENMHFSLKDQKPAVYGDRIKAAESKYIEHINEEFSSIKIEPEKTFENFIVGPSNNLACATTKAVAQHPGKEGKYPCLYIHSSSGLGKTHLMHAVANEVRLNFPHLAVCLTTARDFMNEMIGMIQKNAISDFRKKYSEKIDILLIDDIHELKDKQGTQNEFFHIFNELHTKGKQLIFTSDKAPSEIIGIEERIKTRLQWGLVIDIQKPDLETRIAILRKKAAELDLFLHDDIVNFIAVHIRSSIRELEGALIKLSAFSDVMKVSVDYNTVKELLLFEGPEGTEKVIDIQLITKITSLYYGIPVPDLKSKARNKEMTKARHIAMYLSSKIGELTLSDIGEFFGGRDHTTVMHAIKKISEDIVKDSNLAQEVCNIETRIHS